jgi:MurNAc alpha-1-phosphate uridylyltransferase
MKIKAVTQDTKVMILAAGRGNRLRPLTDDIPKPLIKVQNKSLIERHLEKIPNTQVVVNHAWLGEKIEAALGDGHPWRVSITYSPEPEGGLETAGGIVQALPYLTDGKTPFMVVNGDVLTNFDLENLRTQPLPAHSLAHLILVPTPTFKSKGDFGLSSTGKVLNEGDYTFAGISLLHPDLLKGQSAQFAPLAPILRQAIQNGQVTGELFTGYWSDIGTLERLEAAQIDFQI